MKIRLAVREGGHVADVEIPPFVARPDVLVWGIRCFMFHAELSNDGDDVIAEYREAFMYVIPPSLTRTTLGKI